MSGRLVARHCQPCQEPSTSAGVQLRQGSCLRGLKVRRRSTDVAALAKAFPARLHQRCRVFSAVVTKMAPIVVLGGGFAGLWAAAGAARKLTDIAARHGDVELLLVDRNPYHNIRVRNYEIDLSNVAIPLG